MTPTHLVKLTEAQELAATKDDELLQGLLAKGSEALIEGLSSRSDLAMIPAQDVLGLGSEARMNTPGEPHGNWRWRLEPGQLTPAHAKRLRAVAKAANRV